MKPEAVDIMVVADLRGGEVQPETYDAIAFGRRLQDLGAGDLGVWVVGEDAGSAADSIAQTSASHVNAVQCDGLRDYVGDAYGAILEAEIRSSAPSFVCTAHTSCGWDWAPGVAARIDAGCVTAVDGVFEDQGRICFRKDAYGGKVKRIFTSNPATTVITVLPGMFPFPSPAGLPPGTVTFKTATWSPDTVRHGGTRPAGTDTSDITGAPVVVAVGNGIGAQENMALIHRLAALLPKAAVAGTRIICDRGWLGYDRQVGVTGASVSPALYVACGLSGASQHVMGMRDAKFVIAINTDPRAPIFNEADICIVEDIVHFIPMVEEACARLANSRGRGKKPIGRTFREDGNDFV